MVEEKEKQAEDEEQEGTDIMAWKVEGGKGYELKRTSVRGKGGGKRRELWHEG